MLYMLIPADLLLIYSLVGAIGAALMRAASDLRLMAPAGLFAQWAQDGQPINYKQTQNGINLVSSKL